MDSERDTAPERHTEKYNLRVAGRQIYRHRFREGQKVRDGGRSQDWGPAGAGCAIRPHPTLVMPFPMIPGTGVQVHPQLAARRVLGSQLP